MLHIISNHTLAEAILQRIGSKDIVVIIDSAVPRTIQHNSCAASLAILLQRARCCVLAEQLNRYGIAADTLVAGIEIIDFKQFVAFSVADPLAQHWP